MVATLSICKPCFYRQEVHNPYFRITPSTVQSNLIAKILQRKHRSGSYVPKLPKHVYTQRRRNTEWTYYSCRNMTEDVFLGVLPWDPSSEQIQKWSANILTYVDNKSQVRPKQNWGHWEKKSFAANPRLESYAIWKLAVF